MSYSSQVIDHFRHPRNFGSLAEPDAIGIVGNPVCGDVMKLYLKIKKDESGQEIIAQIKFETFGCAAAIATSSIITEMALNKTLEESLKIESQQIVSELGQLPPIKIHCSVLAADALSEAVYAFWQKQGKKIPAELEKQHQRIQHLNQRNHH